MYISTKEVVLVHTAENVIKFPKIGVRGIQTQKSKLRIPNKSPLIYKVLI